MIKGIGNDLIEIERIRKAIEKYGLHFLDKLFTKSEQDYCLASKEPSVRFAGRFAAKEAIVKALGIGFGEKIGFLDVEIERDAHGKPHVKFSAPIIKLFHSPRVLITISHSKKLAIATAIWES